MALALAALLLGACSSTFDVLPEKLGGLPASAPERPAATGAYPNVYGTVTPPRDEKPLSNDEQKKLGSELMSLRESQAIRANPPPPPPPLAKTKGGEKKKTAEKKKAPDKKAAEKKPPN